MYLIVIIFRQFRCCLDNKPANTAPREGEQAAELLIGLVQINGAGQGKISRFPLALQVCKGGGQIKVINNYFSRSP